MDVCHAHNLGAPAEEEKPYGIRVSLPQGDSFLEVIGADWQNYHWFHTREARDRALADMQSEHLYSRRGDRPTTVFQPIDPDAE